MDGAEGGEVARGSALCVRSSKCWGSEGEDACSGRPRLGCANHSPKSTRAHATR